MGIFTEVADQTVEIVQTGEDKGRTTFKNGKVVFASGRGPTSFEGPGGYYYDFNGPAAKFR
jgi:hypothetical protein